MNIQDKKIAIVGGGPGGLTLARLLQLKGCNVTVYERDLNATSRIQGGTLDLHIESGLAALEKAGLMDEFRANYRPGADLMRVMDNQATIYIDEHLPGKDGKRGKKEDRPEIDRGPLRNILLNSLQPGTVMWDSHIAGIEPLGHQWKVIFQNGNNAVADILIGADGANSKIRPFVTDIKPFWTGITMLEGAIKDGAKTAPTIHRLLKGGKIFAYGNEKALIVSSKEDGSFGFTVSFKSGEFWAKETGIDVNDRSQVFAWFKKELPQWGSVWWELFAGEDVTFILRPQYCMPPNQHWEARANITLLGDAAHWMPPFAGEGVNMAMLDALQLSEALTDPSFTDTRSAIARYEKQMFARFATIGQGTLFNTEWMHEPNALNDMVAMFGNNKLKQGLFMAKYFIRAILMPFMRKVTGREPNYKGT